MGIRRRHMQELMQKDTYDAWASTFGPSKQETNGVDGNSAPRQEPNGMDDGASKQESNGVDKA